ncbi:spermatogenesis-associated protein 2-like protein [Sander lucioperca]|uniref:Spermatogenesis-associated protein 2 PUB-like domain-containing protein n=1 Tax=Sander lucioperca TaxID=283035 RepID=A0A8C9Z972_SANLU|nr:spermatogenesis-associated protein 2-like protein [Sander lucioperca]XP_031141239.1 spermatogenesis-associated protein 2-like protein [Sander lucioperca]XP_031141240.1 spermatogenesis-associated protein 2-like protein [Sander lucioperca]XP_031141241.1 spermatogenesis-associated protein 2-like protein [Sander lucioperca]XP_035858872.1 spermatogenesis-associated protein 2-like protein [Sander lucioperca]XP_035858873.1 spermatogenesis-associated protein 2-like protein [Sander lucioperca]
MSISRHRARDLLATYDHSLEQQIVGRGSNLACRDEELWKQVEGLLKDGDAQETHCLGLDPLSVMEESLTAAASATAASAGRVKARGGLQGLAKAFEVLEQAALNLYVGPWRDEYKVVKMYSGMFTHYIKPVLSMPQIEKLFGLLGYQPSSSRHEQLRLLSPRVSPASLDQLLGLSCAFFLARCECRLLQTALGKHSGEAQWELSVVRERQRGNSVQVALDNTKKTLDVNQPLMEPFDGEVDLYTDEHVNGGQREAVGNDDESPRSLTWVTPSSASPSAAKTHSNGVRSLSSSSSALSARDNICISTLNCQLAKTSPLESVITRSSSASGRQGRRSWEESRFDEADSHSRSLQGEAMGLCRSEAEADHLCSCLQSSPLCLYVCVECNALHNITCALFQTCYMAHCVRPYHDNTTEEMKELSPQDGSLRVSDMSASPSLTSSRAAMSSLSLCDDPKSILPSRHPISYHGCCDLAQLDPQVLCLSCGVFHSGSCREIDFCQNHHMIKLLGVCSCGRACFRKPLVLCRYCGNEYCRDCWYRNPVVCACGQTFDQSSSV